jgi:putative component of membrane protein insertase Oxa1/YidC/SpoIIIJ protein YidD
MQVSILNVATFGINFHTTLLAGIKLATSLKDIYMNLSALFKCIHNPTCVEQSYESGQVRKHGLFTLQFAELISIVIFHELSRCDT